MNPKDKAENLYLKYRPIIAGKQFLTGIVLMSEAKELTKQCALIAVDELIIQENNYNNGSFYPSKYWQEVKQEINNL
jgi:hypothetical protein